MLHTVCDCKSKGNNTIKTLNIPLKIRLHGNSCVFDTQSWKPVQKPNSENIQKSKTSKYNLIDLGGK